MLSIQNKIIKTIQRDILFVVDLKKMIIEEILLIGSVLDYFNNAAYQINSFDKTSFKCIYKLYNRKQKQKIQIELGRFSGDWVLLKLVTSKKLYIRIK